MRKQPDRLEHFKSLFREYYPETVRYALFYLHDPNAAEDIAQEIFTKLWEQKKDLEDMNNISGYLRNAAKNSCINYLRHQQVKEEYTQEYLHNTINDEESTEEYLNLIQRLVEQLPPKRREVLELSVIEAKTYQEIADILDLSINTVKDHIKKAYSFLREHAHNEVTKHILFLVFHRPKNK